MKFEQGNEYLDELLTNPETARQVAAAQRRPMIPAQAVEAHNCDSAWFIDQYGDYRCARCSALLTEEHP